MLALCRSKGQNNRAQKSKMGVQWAPKMGKRRYELFDFATDGAKNIFFRFCLRCSKKQKSEKCGEGVGVGP